MLVMEKPNTTDVRSSCLVLFIGTVHRPSDRIVSNRTPSTSTALLSLDFPRVLMLVLLIAFSYSNPRISFTNWLTGSQEEPGNRCHSCSASAQTMEAEPPDMRYQAEPGNEYNHLGLL